MDNANGATQSHFEPVTYFVLKAQLLEVALKEEQARHILTTCELARHQLFTQAGLDPARQYSLIDANTSAVAVPVDQG